MVGSLGVAQAIAVFRRSWRVGVLGYSVLHFAFHAINHLADIGESNPDWNGPVTFVTVTAGAVLIGWMLWAAAREELRR
jgi:hypothetical protein